MRPYTAVYLVIIGKHSITSKRVNGNPVLNNSFQTGHFAPNAHIRAVIATTNFGLHKTIKYAPHTPFGTGAAEETRNCVLSSLCGEISAPSKPPLPSVTFSRPANPQHQSPSCNNVHFDECRLPVCGALCIYLINRRFGGTCRFHLQDRRNNGNSLLATV
jgi:hypothetical protein